MWLAYLYIDKQYDTRLIFRLIHQSKTVGKHRGGEICMQVKKTNITFCCRINHTLYSTWIN